MLISAAAGDWFNSLIAEKSSNNRHSSSDSNETQLKGQNSFGKYIERTASKDKEEGIKPLSLKADSDSFKVSKIDFDLESGKLTVVTTQCSACTLKVGFIDDDNPNNVYELKTGVKAGEKVETVLSVDKGQLPEFFKVRAVLTDTYGNELGDPFSLSKYMRFMQELDKATVNDYNEEYVVNLDADETTNFLVLNEDTIMAESSEEENTLVSADYDNDVYVFENINDSIRYLSAGDYFYAQPNEKDMVAVNVESIDIDGDTATIRGGGEVDDMFDVIKLEVGSDEVDTFDLENDNVMDDVMINGVSEEENDEYSIAYNGTAEDESGNQYLEYNVLKYSDTNTPQSNFKLFDKIATVVDTVNEIGKGIIDFSSILNDGGKIKIPFEWQIGSAKRDENGNIETDEDDYEKKKLNTIGKDFIDTGKDGEHLYSNDKLSADVKCGFEITAKIKLTFEANLTFYKYKKELEFGWDGSTELKLEAECSAKLEVSFDFVKIPIPTPIPGLGIELGCKFKFGIEASISISTGYKSPFSYHLIKHADGSKEEQEDYDTDKDQKDQENKFEVKGKFYIEITPSIGIWSR